MTIEQKFDMLGIDNAPGQEALQKSQALELRGSRFRGRWLISPMEMWTPIFPTPGSFEGVRAGA